MKRYVYLLLSLFALVACSGDGIVEKTVVSIVGDEFYINGEPTFKGRIWNGIEIQGLLPNSRMVNGIFDDMNDSTRNMWAYPDTKVWDADRNTDEFVDNMPDWKNKGLLAFTINLQGGSPEGYSKHQPWYNSGLKPNGDLDMNYIRRLKRILDEADRLGMVVILGIYYQDQEWRMKDSIAVRNGIRNTVEWVLKNGYQNVMLEINNECDVYRIPGLSPETVHESIKYAKSITHEGRRLLVSTSYIGRSVPSDSVIAHSDFVLLHGNKRTPDGIIEQITAVRNSPSYTIKPIIYNEDDHYDFDMPVNNFLNATKNKVSWGFFDYRRKGEAFEEGFQSIPADWSIGSERKKAFFNQISQWK